MPFRFRTFVTLATVIAAIAAVLGLWVFAATLDDGSILPGVPPSHLERTGLDVQFADPAAFPVDASTAAATTQELIWGQPAISGTIPVTLESVIHPVYAGPAWAVMVDTSTGYRGAYEPLGCLPCRASVSVQDEYFVAFINAETGEWLRSLTPPDDVGYGTPTQVPGLETASP